MTRVAGRAGRTSYPDNLPDAPPSTGAALTRAKWSLATPTARIVAALSLTQLIGWGSTFWLPAVTGPAMAADLGMSLPMIMAGPTIMLVVMGIISWPLSSTFERYGARQLMTAGSSLGATGLLLLGLAEGPVSYALAWVIIGFAGAGMLTTPAQIAVAEVAGEKSRHALGVLILAGGLTSTIVWPLTGFLQAHWGWRITTLIYAALMLLVCMPLHWTMLARRSRKIADEKSAAEPPAVDCLSLALLAATFAATGFFTWGFALTIIFLLESKGLDHASALAAAAFIGIAQWAGRSVNFLGGRSWSGFAIALAGIALFPLSFIVLMLTGTFTGAVLFATLYGIASGITAINRATLPLQIFRAGAYAHASARLALPLNLSYASAPPIFAAVMTSACTNAALWLAFVVSIGAFSSLLALWQLHRKMQRT